MNWTEQGEVKNPWTFRKEIKLWSWVSKWNKFTGENWFVESQRNYAKVTIVSDKGNRALVSFRPSTDRWTVDDVRRDGQWTRAWTR